LKTPCEVATWYILPAIRREPTRVMVRELSLSQRKAADKLGLTHAAVSQYLKGKRGRSVEIRKEIMEKIRGAAREIATSKDPEVVTEKICQICRALRASMPCSYEKRSLHEADNVNRKGVTSTYDSNRTR